ncbi:DNA internalization-related competence protein ComEC/Rec2 [Rossellomorea aquimaris]|uniref:DNA internalization-related competence protein ComEC/Rec2 n=1 Tax=Rossellomorea TaxID=2837508 RepID=UPI001653D07B|nr:DNA internalization-related competence protein ComEC/Rec2 [Rossellomorea vietnamensis]
MKKGQLIYPALSVLAGTTLALHFHWGAFFLAVFLVILFIRQHSTIILALSLAFLPSSFFLASYQIENNVSKLLPGQTEYSIVFTERPEIDGDRLLGQAEVKGGEPVILRYTIPDEQQKAMLMERVYTGLNCSVSGELKEPGRRRNMNSFDYNEYLNGQRIHWILQVNSLNVDQCSYKRKSLPAKLGRWREKGISSIEHKFPEAAAGISAALVFGERDLIGEETLKAYQRLGVIHLLAISGLHVGMLFAAFYYILLRLGIPKEYVQLILLVVLPIYVLLTGGAPPVIRASGILCAVILSGFFRLKLSALDAVSIVFLIYLLINPYSINNIGFQLSFLVSFSLVLSTNRILAAVQQKWKQVFLVTAVCQICSIPVLLWHFYEFSVIGFVVNSFYVPYFTIVLLPLCLLTFLIMMVFEQGAELFFPLLKGAVIISDSVSLHLNSLPFITYTSGKPPLLLAFLYILAVGYCFVRSEKAKWPSGFLPMILLLFLHKISIWVNPYGEVMMVDVGQGDCLIIDLPFNEGVYMVDTGGVMEFEKEAWRKRSEKYSISEDVLLPLLKSKGIQKIDKLILTHSDFDHTGAASDLIERVEVGEILITPGSQASDVIMELSEKAAQFNIMVEESEAGEKWSTNSADFIFLYPFDDHYEGNDDSLVLFGKMGGKKWMFTGDLEENGERELMKKWNVETDVLKVGHHGSKTSTSDAFLDKLKPDIALVSAGKDNRYGHPDPEVLNRLKSRGITIYNTADSGAVHYKYLGSKGTFKPVIP